MLDFGTEMDRRGEPEEQDFFDNDGFEDADAGGSAADAPDGGSRPDVSPTKVAEAAAVPAGEGSTESPVRPPVKPPVLPKCELLSASKYRKEQPGLRNSPHFLHRRRKSEEFSDEDKREVSRILKASRTAAGLSIQDVEHATQIRGHYLNALEDADYDQLPQSVYVLAYLRKLCELYSIPEDEEENLVRPWRNIHHELPENLPASVQQDSENPNGKILRNLEIAIISVGAMIGLGLIVLVIVLIVSYFSGKDVVDPSFDNSELLELQEKPSLITPSHPAVRRR